MTQLRWKYCDASKMCIYRSTNQSTEIWSIQSDVYQQLVAEGYEFEEPDPPPILPPQPPTLAERLEAAEALIDMMLEAGGEVSNG